MKKYLFIGLMLLFVYSGFAQMPRVPVRTNPGKDHLYSLSPLVVERNSGYHYKRNIGDEHSVWLSFAGILADYTGSTASYETMMLFPDTNVLIRYLDVSGGKYVFTYDYTSWCSVGEALNPLSDYIGLTNLWENQSYTVDSIGFYYIYERYGSNSIPDTLVLQVYKPDNLDPYTYVSDSSPAFAVAHFDRTKVQGKNADYTSKIALGINDTATFDGGHFGYYQFGLPANFEVTNGGPVGFTMTYKPGISYKFNDTIPLAKYDSVQVSKPLNAFLCGTYWDETQEDVHEYNNGMVINSQNRYTDYNTDFPDGAYLAGQMWTNPWYLAVWFKITYTEEVEGINGLSNNVHVNIFPNPVQSNSQVQVDLKLDRPENISFEIYDLPGHLVSRVPARNYTTGSHSVSIPAKVLHPGLYLVKISAENSSASYKLRVE